MDKPRVPWNYTLPNGNVAVTMDVCFQMLRDQGIPPVPEPTDGSLWCNATYDTVLCWPPTPANTSIVLPCPPLKGLDPTRHVVKSCDRFGRWAGKTEGVYENPWGWTNFIVCFKMGFENVKIAQEVAKNARKLEFVGLGLSLVSLIVSIGIFSYFRRLRVFRNMLHLHLMIAILMVVIIRLVLYIDLIFTGNHVSHQSPSDGKTINTMPFVCEAMYFLLEYFKTVAFGWMFLEGFYLHNQLVLTVFNSEPRLTPYLIAGYGIPLLHTLIWLFVVLIKKDFKVERCLGSYYLEPEFWILDGPRMAELVVNLFFICNVIRVLWSKVRESHSTSELDKMKKSVKAALMLIPLLGIPNIMQTIPFAPTRDNITVFAIWTYLASFTYMYQGLMITIIYCFTNKEVNTVLKAFYDRYRLQHTSQNELRRGSRSIASHYQARNGQVTGVTLILDNNNGASLSPYTPRSKKGSEDSTAKLMLSVPQCGDELVNNNGYGAASERTPLKTQCDCSTELRTMSILNGQHVA
uniref:G_PROTEIN_RECEP_F2_4 domain-containing protein n=1 Tax=Haemonchus contortus TaxID=6289 RepID=A0A7I4YG03_HAECO|nr:GPCR domain containing protein [Haemonchus contortus]CDJ87422.1 GPCR domain containing protein [Haemonchus contortus]